MWVKRKTCKLFYENITLKMENKFWSLFWIFARTLNSGKNILKYSFIPTVEILMKFLMKIMMINVFFLPWQEVWLDCVTLFCDGDFILHCVFYRDLSLTLQKERLMPYKWTTMKQYLLISHFNGREINDFGIGGGIRKLSTTWKL